MLVKPFLRPKPRTRSNWFFQSTSPSLIFQITGPTNLKFKQQQQNSSRNDLKKAFAQTSKRKPHKMQNFFALLLFCLFRLLPPSCEKKNIVALRFKKTEGYCFSLLCFSQWSCSFLVFFSHSQHACFFFLCPNTLWFSKLFPLTLFLQQQQTLLVLPHVRCLKRLTCFHISLHCFLLLVWANAFLRSFLEEFCCCCLNFKFVGPVIWKIKQGEVLWKS